MNTHSMIEQYKDKAWAPYNTSLNQNFSDWKFHENNVTINDHDMVEFKIDLSDAVF